MAKGSGSRKSNEKKKKGDEEEVISKISKEYKPTPKEKEILVPRVGFEEKNMGEEIVGDFKVIKVKDLRRKACGVESSEKARGDLGKIVIQ
ncbi:hypothetical protein ACLOJK_036689, partial [Asimina triloba]